MESSLACAPAKSPCWLNARRLTWYITASFGAGTCAYGVPYCAGVLSPIGGFTGGTKGGAELPLLHASKKINKAVTIFIFIIFFLVRC